jgi:protein-S-isoprenylcysteine O-methyltransferase Ste14
MTRGISIVSVYLVALTAILFGSAGRMNWALGWTALGIYQIVIVASLFLVSPELVAERSYSKPGIQKLDVIIAAVSFLFLIPVTLAIAGLDVGRFGWTPWYPMIYHIIALVIYALGHGCGLCAMVCNRFFSTFVRIQQDRHHTVVDSGPYRYIRHPGYAGAMLAAIALPFALGSFWALIAAFVGSAGFVLRLLQEEKVLFTELNGYSEYARRVSYRLLLGIW